MIAALLMSMTLLGGCSVAELFHFLGGSETVTVVKIECPQLSPPPDTVIDALAEVKTDPGAGQWIVDLERHYQKLDTCRP